MHKINIFLFILLVLSLTGCEDKKTQENATYVENTTEVVTSTQNASSTDERFTIQRANKDKNGQETIDTTSYVDSFRVEDMKQTQYTVDVNNKKVTFSKQKKDIVLVTFFATWCAPCLADIPYMNDLHKKYEKSLLLSGILVHDTISNDAFKVFLAKNDVKYFVSKSKQNNDFASLIAKTLRLPKDFSIPLTVMYVKGQYFTHYEGCVPVEMIDYDIQQALKTLH